MSVAFLYPGQGSHKAGMLHELPDHPVIRDTLEEACTTLGEDILQLDSTASLLSTRSVQLCLLIYGTAITRLLAVRGAVPDMVAGHSVGAFTAAVATGSLRFPDALQLVSLRGTLMQNAFPAGFGMGVILGLDANSVIQLTEEVNTPSMPVHAANFNAPDQVVISGSLEAMERVFSAARSIGARQTRLLPVRVPSHSDLLNAVSNALARAMESVDMKDPVIPCIGNSRARTLLRADDIREDLTAGVAQAVRWHDATTLMFERGVRLFVEPGPSDTLTSLATKAFPEARCVTFASSGTDSIALLVDRERSR